MKKKKIIFICTGNSCRSQIAHGLMNDFTGDRFDVFSAGTSPAKVHPAAIEVMREIDIDISHYSSNYINDYFNKGIRYVVTVCDNARNNCPVFQEDAIKIHWKIDDPIKNWDPNEKNLEVFRNTRDMIKEKIKIFLNNI